MVGAGAAVTVTAVEKLSPGAYLASRVDALDGHWLELLCGCGLRAFYPCKLLARTCGGLRVGEVHGRFRCQQCGGRAVRVGVTDNPARGLPYLALQCAASSSWSSSCRRVPAGPQGSHPRRSSLCHPPPRYHRSRLHNRPPQNRRPRLRRAR